MKRTKNDRIPLSVRTIMIMLLLYALSVFVLTWYIQREARTEPTEICNTDEIVSDLKSSRTAETDSAAYIDGFNQAEAFRLARYYRYSLFDKYKNYDGDVDIELIHADIDKDGKLVSIDKLHPGTAMMIGLPYMKNSRNVVFADSFGDEQVEEIANAAAHGGAGFIENISGWQNGRFFYPDELTIYTDGDSKVTVEGYPPHSGVRIRNTSMQDYSIYLPNGSRIGKYGYENNMSEKFEQDSWIEWSTLGEAGEDFRNRDNWMYVSGGLSSGYPESVSDTWRENMMYDVYTVRRFAGDGYFVCIRVRFNTWMYAADLLRNAYYAIALLMIAGTAVILFVQSNMIGDREDAERRRRLMTDSLAHDMKTPLSVIRSYGELLADEKDEEKRREFARTIIRESDGLNDRVVNMLDISKMEEGTYPMDISDFSVSVAALQAMEQYRVLADEKGMSIEIDIPEDLRLYADRRLFIIALGNYLSNAVKYGTEGTVIRVTAEKGYEDIRISVCNAGPAPDSERKDRGTGIGLTSVDLICRLHGGRCGHERTGDENCYWMELRSQEERIGEIRKLTGPIRGIRTGVMRMRGMYAIIAGTILQGIFGSGILWIITNALNAYGAIIRYDRDLISIIGVMFGSVLIMRGQLLIMKDNGFIGSGEMSGRMKTKGVSIRAITVVSSLMSILMGAGCCFAFLTSARSSETIWLIFSEIMGTGLLLMIICLILNFRMLAIINEMAGRHRHSITLANEEKLMGVMGLILIIVLLSIYKFDLSYTVVRIMWPVITVTASIMWLRGMREE